MKLIGINGLKTSGKDTAYELIAKQASGRVERRAFADKLKIMAASALGFNGEDDYLIDLMNQAKEGWGINMVTPDYESTFIRMKVVASLSGRQYLQNFGSYARQLFGDSFWVDQVLPEERTEFEKVWRTIGRQGAIAGIPAIGCVTDVRYPNEAARVLALGGTVLEIVRPGLESDGHDSEKPLPREFVSATVYNSGTIDDLREVLRLIVEEI